MTDVSIRALEANEVSRVWELGYASLVVAGRAYGWDMPALDDAVRERGRKRLQHVLRHDPEGALVADRGGELVGVALATRRERLWFLSLLAVDTAVQAQGIGRRLLDAALRTLDGAGAICASDDPKALRRYRAAGFDLHPCYEAKGTLDRSLLPAVGDVKPGSYAGHRDLIEEIARLQRGAAHGPDLDFFEEAGRPVYIIDSSVGRGYVVCADAAPSVLAATTERAAQVLLWTALGEATAPTLEVLWLGSGQQWALDVALEARLTLRPTGSLCVTGAVGPMSPYIPNGGLG